MHFFHETCPFFLALVFVFTHPPPFTRSCTLCGVLQMRTKQALVQWKIRNAVALEDLEAKVAKFERCEAAARGDW